ncbi:MAG: Maf family protein [Pseudomonadota bacterium]
MYRNSHMKAQGKIILASASPRRKELLKQLGIPVEVVPSDVEEAEEGIDPRTFPLSMAIRKIEAVRARLGASFRGWLIGADTIVALGTEVFGKPRDKSEAHEMLRRLSNQTHTVYTGYRVEDWAGKGEEGTVVTDVTFCELSDEEIEAYISTGEPMDKAGAYALQGRGGAFIRSISGSHSNVIGLPLFEVVRALRRSGAVR